MNPADPKGACPGKGNGVMGDGEVKFYRECADFLAVIYISTK
ncbi:MAG: hypothetical protein PWP41_1972 [Moorella sp. (in: firmicutes)]|nr:hypothetical protein [Moorella sp. (in: firmicutes)]